MDAFDLSRKVRELTPLIPPYTAVIEGPEGTTFEQDYYTYEELLELLDVYGEDYRLVCIY